MWCSPGIAIYFLWALPERLQRHGDLATLQRLRSLAHVIDMHQLTKDPERLRSDFQRTSASVPLDLTAIELLQLTSTTARNCCRWSARPPRRSASTLTIAPP